jgi:hypothetical protein
MGACAMHFGFQHKDVTKLELDKETGRRYEGIDKPIP